MGNVHFYYILRKAILLFTSAYSKIWHAVTNKCLGIEIVHREILCLSTGFLVSDVSKELKNEVSVREIKLLCWQHLKYLFLQLHYVTYQCSLH